MVYESHSQTLVVLYKSYCLHYAVMVYESQSQTLEGHVRICPGKAPGHVSHYWTLRHLLVAASRARTTELLSIE